MPRFAFLLTLFQAQDHMVGEDDWFVLDLGHVTVLASQHVHLALVKTQLANVRLRGRKGVCE